MTAAPQMRTVTGALLVAVTVLVAGCGGTDAGTTTTAPLSGETTTAPASTTTAPTTTTAPDVTTTTGPPTTGSTTSTPPDDGPVTALVPTAGDMDPGWEETLFIPYGDGEDTLGTSPGGDGGSVDWGPEYGTQTPDGTWWFLDAARLRLAHFDADGGYLGAVGLTEDQLVDGRFFQFQMPQALDDGTVIASRATGAGTQLLVLAGEVISLVDAAAEVGLVTTDGAALFGQDYESGGMAAVTTDGAVTPIEFLNTRAGTRFGFRSMGDEHIIELPDAGVTRQVILRWADDPLSPAFAGTEVETGPDGTLHVYLYGAPEVDESIQLAGYYSVSPTGEVSAVETSRNPFSPSDPGSPAHLGIDFATGQPWLMFVDPDGVRVLTRTG